MLHLPCRRLLLKLKGSSSNVVSYRQPPLPLRLLPTILTVHLRVLLLLQPIKGSIFAAKLLHPYKLRLFQPTYSTVTAPISFFNNPNPVPLLLHLGFLIFYRCSSSYCIQLNQYEQQPFEICFLFKNSDTRFDGKNSL